MYNLKILIILLMKCLNIVILKNVSNILTIVLCFLFPIVLFIYQQNSTIQYPPFLWNPPVQKFYHPRLPCHLGGFL